MHAEHVSWMTKQQCTEKVSHLCKQWLYLVRAICYLSGNVDVPLHSHELLDSKEGDYLAAQQKLPATVGVHHMQKNAEMYSQKLV